jgi:hypothetical protein
MDEFSYITAQSRNFPYHRCGNEHVLLAGGEEYRFDLGVEAAVHSGHLEFVFEVGHGAQTAHDNLGSLLVHEVHEQGIETADLDIGQVMQDFRRHLDAVGQRKARLLGRAFGNGQDQLVEQRGGTPNQVFMAPGDGSKVPG